VVRKKNNVSLPRKEDKKVKNTGYEYQESFLEVTELRRSRVSLWAPVSGVEDEDRTTSPTPQVSSSPEHKDVRNYGYQVSFLVSTSFFLCEQGRRQRVTDVKSPFCERAFPVVTREKDVSLPRKKTRRGRHEFETSGVCFVTTRFRWSIFLPQKEDTKYEFRCNKSEGTRRTHIWRRRSDCVT
jgi:hypothetical protein